MISEYEQLKSDAKDLGFAITDLLEREEKLKAELAESRKRESELEKICDARIKRIEELTAERMRRESNMTNEFETIAAQSMRIIQLEDTIKERDETIAAQDKHREELEAENSVLRDEECTPTETLLLKRAEKAEAALAEANTDWDHQLAEARKKIAELEQRCRYAEGRYQRMKQGCPSLAEASAQPREKRYKESDACPETGETDCPYCSGELCEKHGNEPCECDTADRHDKVAQLPEARQPVPPEITEFLAHIEDNADHYWSPPWHRIHAAVRVLAERMVGK